MNKVVVLLYLLTLYQEGCVAMTTSSIVGCIIEGRYFQPGEEISRGTEGSWCHGSICSGNGIIMEWDGKCGTDVSTWPNIRQPTTTQQEPFTTPQQPSC
ncbi:hypothetical protein CHS0354_001152 [Potamilus streckersoni]|uniref:Secreted protein n=1 Tax=Potamilus streckersoni TaxID=2493646 RepID=A0AAE0RLY4_9BIVA|nr:hypothetical protein CHS0354_001152 [Potamilus streckersoni]